MASPKSPQTDARKSLSFVGFDCCNKQTPSAIDGDVLNWCDSVTSTSLHFQLVG
jgi:hypothetical protein